MAWTNEIQPFGSNHAPLLTGLSNAGDGTAVPVAVDPATGRLLTSSTGASGGTSSNFSSTFPSVGTAVGASDGTNMQPLLVDASGYLEVNVKAGSGSGLSVIDEAAWTGGSSQFVPTGGVFNDSATALTSGQEGTQRFTTNRAGHVNLRDTSGTEIGTTGSPVYIEAASATSSGVPSYAFFMGIQSGSNLLGVESLSTASDASAGNQIIPTGEVVYNNSTFDIVRSSAAVTGTTGKGLKGAGAMGIYNSSAPSANNGDYYPLQLDGSANLLVNLKTAIPQGNNDIGYVGTVTAVVKVGQTTSNTSAVQLSSTSTPSTNGILVQALSGNTASVFIGGSGVTTSTGYELQAGQAVPFTVSNITGLYVIGSNSSDGVCWNVM